MQQTKSESIKTAASKQKLIHQSIKKEKITGSKDRTKEGDKERKKEGKKERKRKKERQKKERKNNSIKRQNK